ESAATRMHDHQVGSKEQRDGKRMGKGQLAGFGKIRRMKNRADKSGVNDNLAHCGILSVTPAARALRGRLPALRPTYSSSAVIGSFFGSGSLFGIDRSRREVV